MSQRTRERRDRRRRQQVWLGGAAGAIAVALVAGGVVAISGGDTEAGPTQSTRVAMTEFAFDPDPIVVDAGTIALDVANEGAVAHNLLVGGLGKGTPELGPGESHTLELEDVAPGTYPVICDLSGHREAGMTTELVVR